jgi:hypothetical protein
VKTSIPTCMLAMLALATSGCWEDAVAADPRDQGWALRSARLCPAVAPAVKSASTDGIITVADVEVVSGAVAVARSNPVKGQVCDMKYATPPSSRDYQVPDGTRMMGKLSVQNYRTVRSPE